MRTSLHHLKKHIISQSNNGVVVVCRECHKKFPITVTPEQITTWHNGGLIQDVMPELSKPDRELLISGYCDSCFDKIFFGD